MRRLTSRSLLLAVTLTACTSVNAPPCSELTPCERGVCTGGHCLPECAFDLDCAGAEVCLDETCVPAPQCAADPDCAAGFSCQQAQCRCQSDAACALNEACIEGGCRDRPACDADEDCAPFGLRCERGQGLCVPSCTTAAQCAPGVDPTLAGALYACEAGTCFQRCASGATCAAGLSCLEGLCTVPECFARADCGAGAYCTAAGGGQCLPYTPCTEDTQCPANFGCSAFPAEACPPEVDCAARVCRELPTCTIDQDCAAPAFCADGHCQPTVACDPQTPCPEGRDCVGGACVPHVCRGPEDCPDGLWCSDGACVAPAAPAELAALSLFADARVVEAGDVLPLTLIGFRAGALGGTPIASAQYSVTAPDGSPSSAATVSEAGLLTANAAGEIRVQATVPGSAVTAPPLTLHLVGAPGATQTQVVVIDAATLEPLAGVRVLGCEAPSADGPCAVPLEQLTDASGAARFPFASAAASFAAASPQLRGDGLPAYDRVSLPFTGARTVVLPLRPNRLHADAAQTFGFSLQGAPGEGAWWLGLPIASLPSLHELRPGHLLGDPFLARLPGVEAAFPLPGALTLSFAAPGFGGPLPLQDRSRVLTTAGQRGVIAFAGRVDVPLTSALAGVPLLQYVGGLGAAFAAPFAVAHLPHVPDVGDLDGDGRCPDAASCPGGSEDRPDYPSTPTRVFSSFRPQPLRTEVAPPALPAGLNTALILQVMERPGSGLLPLGVSARTAGLAAPDGTLPVAPLVVRSASPAAGYEASTPGVAVIATALDANGLPAGSFAVRQTRGARLPETVAPPAFLPLPTLGSFAGQTRTWEAAPETRSALGAVVYRVVIQGPDSAHVVWVPLAATPGPLRIPDTPAGAGTDAAGSTLSVAAEETAIELADGLTFEDAVELQGASWARPGGLSAAASTRR